MMPIRVPDDVAECVARALSEDIGHGDVTALLIDPATHGEATVITREAAVICGRPWFDAAFLQLDSSVTIEWLVEEGAAVGANTLLCRVHGNARSLLTAERTALNFLQLLSGTATAVKHYVEIVADLPVRLLDTRKTIPGLRTAQKYAVRCGGGHNHRMGLFDAVLIKENHILAAGSIAKAVAMARAHHAALPVEVEVETLAELEQALTARADSVLLDNFTLPMMRDAVRLAGRRIKLEVSGGVSLDTLRDIALTGVDVISIGAMTKHLRAVDLSMRFVAG